MTITAFNSGNNSEKITSIPSGYVYKIALSCSIGSIATGDIVLALSEIEVTNNSGTNQMLGSRLLLTNSPLGLTGQEISEDNAMNVTPNMHHMINVKNGVIISTTAYADAYVNLVVWSGTGIDIVEQDYGRLSGLIIKQ